MSEIQDWLKYRASVQYVGTRYAGWQSQPNQKTIQETIQQALQRLNGVRINVIASGRTDSGVHARGQVVHFRQPRKMETGLLRKALNAMLPTDVRIMSVARAASSFHAQKDARRKRYEYHIFNGPVLDPFRQGRVHHLRRRVSFERMQRASPQLEGIHDFSAFAASSSRVKDPRRTVFVSQFRKRGHSLVYRIEGSGFLHHMVRNIVGTLLEIGSGRRPESDLARILASRDRRNAGPTAPPEGLYLMRVWY